MLKKHYKSVYRIRPPVNRSIRFIFAGDPADIIAHCARLYDAGAQRVELGAPRGVCETATGIDMIGTMVIPALKPYLSPQLNETRARAELAMVFAMAFGLC